jgi:CheY-like chemotaxis protein
MNALIVDDNATNREILQHHLDTWGIPNQSAEDGYEALKMLRDAAASSNLFDIVLLDFMMPAMDGLTLAKIIKADEHINKIRLILLSSVDHLTDEEIQQAGIISSFHKPVRQSQLYDQLVSIAQQTYIVSSERHKHTHSLPHVRFQARILLAEDNSVNQKVAQIMLEKMGCQVDVAGDGKKAVALAKANTYDLIFMDCEMPEMDGVEATQAIRQANITKKMTPIVALTAHAMEGDKEYCLSQGMDDYLGKPFTQMQLISLLQKWLKAERQ